MLGTFFCMTHILLTNSSLCWTGSTSGVIPLTALARQTDGSWAIRFVPPRQEAITIRLAVDGVVAAQQVLTVDGRSPTALDLAASMRQATLTSQAAAVTVPLANGSSPVSYAGEVAFLRVPVLDRAGSV